MLAEISPHTAALRNKDKLVMSQPLNLPGEVATVRLRCLYDNVLVTVHVNSMCSVGSRGGG